MQQYAQLKQMAEHCDDNVLYGAVMTMQATVPAWRDNKELIGIAQNIAHKLESSGWRVELGLTQEHRRFWLTPPEGTDTLDDTCYPLNTGREKAGVVRAGHFYINDRRKDD